MVGRIKNMKKIDGWIKNGRLDGYKTWMVGWIKIKHGWLKGYKNKQMDDWMDRKKQMDGSLEGYTKYMDGWMDVWIDGWMEKQMDGWKEGRITK